MLGGVSFRMRKTVILLLLLSIANIVSAEIITLKTGEIIKGDIVDRDSEGISIFSGYGLPLQYSISEIETIDVEENDLVISQDDILTYYGVKYDIRTLGGNYNVSDLIISLAEIAEIFDIAIHGVKVLEKGIAWDLARIAITSDYNREDDVAEDRRYILIISPDLAYNLGRMIRILKKEPITEQQKIDATVKRAQKNAISSFFGSDNIENKESETVSAKIADGTVRILESFAGRKRKNKDAENLRIYNYYLSFKELFGKEDAISASVKEPEKLAVVSDEDNEEDLKSLYDVREKYFDNGQVSGEYSYSNNKLDGLSREYHESGALKAEILYTEGIRVSTYKEYYEDGKIKYVESYKNGIVDGIVKEYFASEQLSGEFAYKEGKLNGNSVEYYESGAVKVAGKYSDDRKHGEFISYYENGDVFKIESYSEGEQDGIYREFFKSGLVKIEMHLDRGIRIGSFKELYEDGKIAYIENYKDGLVDGIAKEYYQDGQLHIETLYEKGGIVKQVVYDQKGKEIPSR